MTLWHYTCDHRWALIGDVGELLPAYRLTDVLGDWWPARFVWLTDLSVPDRTALGLDVHKGACDRTTYRYRVTDETGVRPWTDVRRGLVRTRHVLEDVPGVRLRHWYVSPLPVPVVLDQRP